MSDLEYLTALKIIASGTLFADLPEDLEEREQKVKDLYREYALLVHPDKRPGNAEAATAFRELEKQKNEALQGFKPFTLQTKIHTYEVTSLESKGRMRSVYVAKTEKGDQVFIKIPHSNRDNDLMDTERKHFCEIELFRNLIIESFLLLARDREGKPAKKRAVVVTDPFNGEGVTLEDIRAAYPKGVDCRIMAFILNRIMECLSCQQAAGMRNGAVTPNHVIINPHTHEGYLCDWTDAGPFGQKLIRRSRYKDYFPPEYPYHGFSADLFGAAKCAVYVLGGDPSANEVPPIPLAIQEFLNRCLQPHPMARFRDANVAYPEFRQVLQQTYGPPKFIPLEL